MCMLVCESEKKSMFERGIEIVCERERVCVCVRERESERGRECV